MPHVRRWVHSRHAILFRMADDSLQVAFKDGSALLLDASARQLGFVSPQRHRLHHVTLAQAPGNAAVVRRLKYVRQLLVAQHAGGREAAGVKDVEGAAHAPDAAGKQRDPCTAVAF